MIKKIRKYLKFGKLKNIRSLSVAIFIVITFVTVTTILLASLEIINYNLDRNRQWKNLRKELSVTAEQLTLSLSLPVWNLDFNQINNIMESAMSNRNIYAIVVVVDGTSYVRARGANWEIITPEKEFPAAGLLLEARDIISSGEVVGNMQVYASTKMLERNLKSTFISLMSFIPVYVIILIISLYFILYLVVLKPVTNIEQYTMSVSSGKGRGLRIKGKYFQGELETLRSSIEQMVNAHEDRFVVLQNEVKLRTESEERFRTIFNSVNDALIICDKDTGYILHVNEKMCEMFGYKYNEAIRNNIDIISPETLPYGLKKSLELFNDSPEKQHFGEWKAKHKEGKVFWVEVSIKETTIDNSARALMAIRDITQRKQAEDERRLSEEKYRNIFERAVEGIFQITPDGKFIGVNPALTSLFCYDSPEEMINSISNSQQEIYVDPEEYVRFTSILERDGIIEGFESQFYRKDRNIIWLSLNARTVCDFDGKVQYYEGTAMDITMRKNSEEEKEKLETQLRQAQKMEAIGTLAGGVAHDFNNILSVVSGYSSLLQMELPPDNPMRAYADQILLASEKAMNLTKSLLAFSRKQPVSLKPLNLNEIITGVEKLLKRLLTEDISLKKNLTDRDVIIMGDATQIDQILFNLATNARDAMPVGGDLTIETKIVKLTEDFKDILGYGEPGSYALLSVYDTGKGIDENTRDHIFDPFFTTKEVGKGTGLGLSTVYGIVKQHNGYITIYSEPGMGTVFHIYFPVISALVEEEYRELPAVSGGKETILVAEDNESVRYFIKTILSKYGYSVIEAVDGVDAIQKYNENFGVNLMIIDSVMPRKNGREVYDEIKKKNPDIKVLFTSGYTRDIILDKGIEEKEVEFLSKPLTPDALLKKVREVIDM